MKPTMTVFRDPEVHRLHCFGTGRHMAFDVYLKWGDPHEMTICGMTSRLIPKGAMNYHVRCTEMKSNPQEAQRLTRRLWRVLAPHLLPYILGEVEAPKPPVGG